MTEVEDGCVISGILPESKYLLYRGMTFRLQQKPAYNRNLGRKNIRQGPIGRSTVAPNQFSLACGVSNTLTVLQFGLIA
jgi:hypothetical protein